MNRAINKNMEKLNTEKPLFVGLFDKIKAVELDHAFAGFRNTDQDVDGEYRRFKSRIESSRYQRKMRDDLLLGCNVYVVQAKESKFVKIGVARSVASRFASLQTAHYEELKVVRAWWCTESLVAYHFESRLHRLYKEHNIRGEWFSIPQEKLDRLVNAPGVYPFAKDIFTRPSDEEAYDFADRALANGFKKELRKCV